MIRKSYVFYMLCLSGFLLVSYMPNNTMAFGEGKNNNPEIIVLLNGVIIDGTGRAPQTSQAVVISGNKIQDIMTSSAASVKYTGQARIIDLKGIYILPGFWNNHSHLSDLLPDPKNILAGEELLPATIRAGRNAMDALKAGFTSLRMTAERNHIDVVWNDAFKAGVFVGPRIIPSGPALTSVGGHGSEGGTGQMVVEISGPEQARAAVRDNVAKGSEIIKLMVDKMTKEEIKAAIDTAHELGVKVTGHASETGGARVAINLGIDGIEHGYALTDETIALMAEKNVFYDPTIVCNLSAEFIAERERLIEEAGFIAPPETKAGRILVAYADERTDDFAARQRSILQKAAKAGVKIITGSDSNPISEIGLLEIEQLVFSGLTPMQAIEAATRNSAEMVGILDVVGTVEIGKLADLVVLSKNPLENISNIRSLEMVIKNGKPVNLDKIEGQPSFWELYLSK